MHINQSDMDNLNGDNENIAERSSSDMKLERFCDRLKAAKGAATASAIAKKTGINESLISKYLSGASIPLIDRAAELADSLDVDLNWLATGRGEMRPWQKLREGLCETTPEYPIKQERSKEIGVAWDDFSLVPVYDVQASAGHGSLVESELQAGQLAFKKAWLKEKGLQVGHLAIITAKGDSMEQTICDGDTLLVDTRVDKIIDDSIYIVQADHHLIVKRLQQDFDGSVFVISDNPRYEKRHLNAEQAKNLKIAGRVCWYGHEI